ncbi:tubulin-like doman-containing protein [Chitinophaga solisilvae]|uniref:tubulin-like doman-containing protein n=1 Tax=Chitinophaga solisilvae TaxID=1233460 RepID=UPI0013706A0D|nr:tubulin-like doman-containing protein [Chitinophaga solisilvae]
METHLIIGIGGTGSRIIHSLKSTIEQSHGSASHEGVNIDYLYIDTSATDLDNALTWKEKTNSIALAPANLVRINKTDMDAILRNIDAYPNIKPWIGHAADWEGSLKAGEIAAAQMRRYGRFLLAGDINKFISSLNAIVASLINRTEDRVRNITFHICCGLAGGTGSGMLIDIIAQIRKIYPFDEARYHNSIFLYTLLPELTPTSWATAGGLYHANGYACMKELNDLSLLKYIPHDLSDPTRQGRRINPVPAVFFNGCYVFTNQNENDVQLNVEEEIPALVGNYIYQQIYSINNPAAREWINRLSRCENGINDPEGDDLHPGKAMRSKRFISFGIKRIGIPEVEIKSHFTAKLAGQTLLQLLYNRWFDGQGFVNEPRIKEFNAYVAAPEQQHRWLLTDSHNILSMLFLPADREKTSWASFEQAWEKKRTECATIVTTEAIPKTEWIMALKKRYDTYYTETFRGEGVSRFFQLREKDMKDTVRYLAGHIDKDLFKHWNNAQYGLVETGYLLNSLIQLLENKINVVTGQHLEKLIRQEKIFIEKITAEDAYWTKIGWIKDVAFKDRIRSFERQNHNLEQLYLTRTMIAGWHHARKLLPEVKKSLEELLDKIYKLQANLNTLLKQNQELIDKTCNDGQPRISDNFVKFYDSAAIRDVTRSLVQSENLQKNQTAGFRAAVENMLEGIASFTQLNKKVTLSEFANQLEKHTVATSDMVNEQMKDIVDGGKKVLNVSITEKLRDTYQHSKEELEYFIRGLVAQAAVFGKYDPVQENQNAQSTRTMEFMVILPPDAQPNGTKDKTFNHMLTDAFKTSRNAGIPEENIIYTASRNTEIVLINIHNLFPLRILSVAEGLKTRYQQALNSTDGSISRRARITLHTEGSSTHYHDLFVTERNKESYMRYIVIADNTGLIDLQPNPETEEKEYILMPENILEDDIIVLGRQLLQSHHQLSFQQLEQFRERVEVRLQEQYKPLSKQAALKSSIRDKLAAFLLMVSNNPRHPEFIRYKDACTQAIAVIDTFNKK